MQPGEIFLAQFPFGDVAGMKLRPVLLLTGQVGPVPEVLVAYISSVMPTQPLPSDLVIDPLEAGISFHASKNDICTTPSQIGDSALFKPCATPRCDRLGHFDGGFKQVEIFTNAVRPLSDLFHD